MDWIVVFVVFSMAVLSVADAIFTVRSRKAMNARIDILAERVDIAHRRMDETHERVLKIKKSTVMGG